MDPRNQLTGSPIERRQAWTAFRAAASRQNGPPVQYPRQRQLSQLQQDIRSSWRWFLHRSHGLTGHSLKGFQPGTKASELGNESSGQAFRSTRPSLAVNYTAHVADSQRFLTAGPAVLKNKRSRR